MRASLALLWNNYYFSTFKFQLRNRTYTYSPYQDFRTAVLLAKYNKCRSLLADIRDNNLGFRATQMPSLLWTLVDGNNVGNTDVYAHNACSLYTDDGHSRLYEYYEATVRTGHKYILHRPMLSPLFVLV